MKKFTLTLIAILFAVTSIFAQTPTQFKYQAVLRDASGAIIANEPTTVKIDILQGSTSGTSIFNETHNVTTTAQGLINLNIGSVEDMSSIDWSANTYFIQITVGSTVMGTSQLLSVPYAMHAKTAENFNEVDGSVTNEIQNLSQVIAEGNSANAQIKNLIDPTDAQDAATKAYVDLLEARIYALEHPPITVTDYDGNIYNAVTIGNQVWMSENLKVTHYPDGTAIPHVTGNTDWKNLGENNTDDAYCFYDNNSSSAYGALYTWAAAMGDNAVSSIANPSGVQGVCPNGWHLPSDAEWAELIDYLNGTNVAGGKLKETGTTHWNSPNTGATNERGFSALPGGCRDYYDGAFFNVGDYGYWWSATESSSSHAWLRYLGYDNAVASRGSSYKSIGLSVRCIKN